MISLYKTFKSKISLYKDVSGLVLGLFILSFFCLSNFDLILAKDISRQSSSLLSMASNIGLSNFPKKSLNSSFLTYKEINFPIKLLSLKKSSIAAEFIEIISSSNSLYINIDISTLSWF